MGDPEWDELVAKARSGSLVELVGKTVELTKRGRGWLGACPLCGAVALAVNDESGAFHCFECNEGGSAIDWIVKTRGVRFGDAVIALVGGDNGQVLRCKSHGHRLG